MITRREEDLLIWYFEEGIGAFWRSPLGASLERQGALAYGGDGRRIAKPAPWTNQATIAHKHRPAESSYMPDEDALLRAASVSRRLRKVAEADAAAEQTLEAYYGAVGARWSRSSVGRVFAIYPLTEAGARLVRDDFVLSPSCEALPHERLAAALEAQRAHPTPERREQLARVHAQAERRLATAWRLWRASNRAATPKSPARTGRPGGGSPPRGA